MKQITLSTFIVYARCFKMSTLFLFIFFKTSVLTAFYKNICTEKDIYRYQCMYRVSLYDGHQQMRTYGK